MRLFEDNELGTQMRWAQLDGAARLTTPTACHPPRLAVGASIASYRWRWVSVHAAAGHADSSGAADGIGATGCEWAWMRPRRHDRMPIRPPSVDAVSPGAVASSSAVVGAAAPGAKPARRHQQLHTSWSRGGTSDLDTVTGLGFGFGFGKLHL